MIRWLFDNDIRTGRDLVGYVVRLTIFCVLAAFSIDFAIQVTFFVNWATVAFSAGQTIVITILVASSMLSVIGRMSRRLSLLGHELERLSSTDALTGIANRRAFMVRLEAAPNTADSLALIDLDHFKVINDRYGHAAGDAVLVEFSRRLSAAFEPSGFVARIGGEEFAVLSTEPHDAVADRAVAFCAAVSQQPFRFEGEEFAVTASIGVAMTDNRSLRDVYADADRALYLAKARGRNQVRDAQAATIDISDDLLWVEVPAGPSRAAA